MDEDIEESARFYAEDNGEIHIRSDFLVADDDEPHTVRAAFILNLVNQDLRSKGILFSIHDEDVPVFRLLRMRARRAPGLIEDAKEVLLKLFDADAEYSADTLEGIYDELEKVSKKVLSGRVTDAIAGEALGAIARHEDMSGRIRRNVMDTRRAVSFLMRSKMLNAEQFDEARQILRDIDSLDSHTAFRQNQLLDGCYGRLYQHQPEQDHQNLFGGQRGLAAADADCKRLWHEFQGVFPGAGMGIRLPVCDCAYGRQCSGADVVLQAARLAEVTLKVVLRTKCPSAQLMRAHYAMVFIAKQENARR